MKYVSGLGLESLFFVLIIMVFGDSETAFDVCQGISAEKVKLNIFIRIHRCWNNLVMVIMLNSISKKETALL